MGALPLIIRVYHQPASQPASRMRHSDNWLSSLYFVSIFSRTGYLIEADPFDIVVFPPFRLNSFFVAQLLFSKIAHRCFVLHIPSDLLAEEGYPVLLSLVLFRLSKGIGNFFAAVGGADEYEECAADDDEAKGPG